MFFGLISKLIIEYELDNGIRISSGGWKNANEAKQQYKTFGMGLPKTRELFNIPSVGKVYCQVRRVFTMLKTFLIFRNKAGIGHGKYFSYNNKILKLKMDLFFEIKNFLLFLINKKLKSLI